MNAMSVESSYDIYIHVVTSWNAIYACIENLIVDRKVQVRANEIFLFVMCEYIKIIPKYTIISADTVRFSYEIKNHSKFREHG